MITIIRRITHITCLLLALLPFSSAHAADPAGEACGQDYKKFCNGIKPGEGRIMKCLTEHREELSPTCRDLIVSSTQKLLQEFTAACQQDVVSHCKNVQAGEGRILNCLRDNNKALSASCQNMLEKM